MSDNHVGTSNHSPKPKSTGSGLILWQSVAIGLLLVGCAVGLYVVFFMGIMGNSNAQEKGKPNPHFPNWSKPKLAIVLSGQSFGYLQPCGCSKPQYGGLVRRYNLVQQMKALDWPVVALDLGDVAQKSGPQAKLKYKYAMSMLDKIGYSAVGIGKHELQMPLLDALSEHSLNNPNPSLLAANLVNAKTNPVILTMVKDTKIIRVPKADMTVGVFGLVAPSVNGDIKDNKVHFTPNTRVVLHDALSELKKQSPDVNVLLYQGSEKEAKLLADYCAKNFKNLPNVDIILCLSDHSEPPATPELVTGTNTRIINVGHKGRYVGVVGVFPAKKGARNKYKLEYQLVSIGPKLDTPEGQEDNHLITKMLEDYTSDVKAGNLIMQYPSNLHEVQLKFPEAKYVGSDRCERCHKSEYKVWEKSYHAHAYKTLVDVKHPSLRQFDGECISCHVIGFEHNTGYGDALKAGNVERAKMLRNVGCESCHGPGSEHIRNKNNKKIHMAMNPWKHRPNPKLAMDTFCQKCHDIDNDVHWNFKRKWPKIIHPLDPGLAPKGNAAPKADANALAIPNPGDNDANIVPEVQVPKKD